MPEQSTDTTATEQPSGSEQIPDDFRQFESWRQTGEVAPPPATAEQLPGDDFKKFEEKREEALEKHQAVPPGVQKRIDKARAKQGEAERRAEAAERKLSELSQAGTPADGQPDVEQIIEQRVADAIHSRAVESFGQRLGELSSDEEFVSAADAIELPQPLIDFLGHALADAKNGPEIYRFLVSNKDVCHELEGLDAAGVIDKIRALDITVPYMARSASNSAPRGTRAPKPVSPVNTRSSPSSDVMDPHQSYEDFEKRRNAQLRNGGRYILKGYRAAAGSRLPE